MCEYIIEEMTEMCSELLKKTDTIYDRIREESYHYCHKHNIRKCIPSI